MHNHFDFCSGTEFWEKFGNEYASHAIPHQFRKNTNVEQRYVTEKEATPTHIINWPSQNKLPLAFSNSLILQLTITKIMRQLLFLNGVKIAITAAVPISELFFSKSN